MSEHVQRIIGENNPDEATAVPHLAGTWLRVARVAWVILALVALGILISSLPGYAVRMTGQLSHVSSEEPTASIIVFAASSGLASLASAVLSLGLAWMFFRRRFDEPVAAALSFYLLIYAVVMAGPLEHWDAYWTDGSLPVETLQALLLATPTVALFLLFPSGRFVPSWTRWVLLLTVPWSLSLFFLPSLDGPFLSEMSPFALTLLAVGYFTFLAAGLYAQNYRYRRVSSAAERQQTKWVMFGFALWLIYILISSVPYFYITSLPAGTPAPWWAPASERGWFRALTIIPVSLALAVSRYRLWDIDLVISRALVYGALTVSVIGVYALVVGTAGALLQTQGNWLTALLATGLVAVLFQPLRERLQRWVNRLVYGQRDEPFEVLTRLGQQLEGTLSPEMVYPAILETVAQTLKVPFTSIAVRQGDGYETAESYGKPSTHLVTYPLEHQGEVVGQLRVAHRAPGEDFTEADERLLRSIARQAGAAIHVVELTTDLQYSRQRLVATREEERRRLRRDLHDGLGPTLAAHMLKIGSARALLDHEQAAADGLLTELEIDVEATLAEVRRLVYNLRPPALDQLGLVGAIRAHVAEYERGNAGVGAEDLSITLDVPDELSSLPAAVEVATYYIVREGLTNVIRHAEARQCTIWLALDKANSQQGSDHLKVSIRDDGQGLPDDYHAGVGLTSMRERAEEVGGVFTVDSAAGRGTRLSAELPLAAISGQEE
jgi:signal transduction histidine kinase